MKVTKDTTDGEIKQALHERRAYYDSLYKGPVFGGTIDCGRMQRDFDEAALKHVREQKRRKNATRSSS